MISLSICRFFIESECFDSDKKSVRLLMGDRVTYLLYRTDVSYVFFHINYWHVLHLSKR